MTDPYTDEEGRGGSPHEAFDPDQMIGPDDVLLGVAPLTPTGDATGFQPGEDRIGTPAEMLAELRHLRAQVNGDPTDSALFVADPDDIEGYETYHVVNYGGDVVRSIVVKTGLDISDGHHTFDELYEHRRKLTAVLATIGAINGDSWRSKLHHPDDGPMFDGSFIVGIELPAGPITYHYPLDGWDEFAAVPVLEHAPKWDGAGPAETLTRLANFTEHLRVAIDTGLVVSLAAQEHAVDHPPRPCGHDACREKAAREEAERNAASLAAQEILEKAVSPCTAVIAADEEQTGP